MKVLFLVNTLGEGGAERSLQEMLPAFRDAGVRPIVACFQRKARGVEQLVEENDDLRVLGGSTRLAQMADLRAIARRERVDLLHTTLFEADVFGRTALVGSGVPVVTSLVNMPYEPARIANDPNVDRARLLAARGLEITTGLLADHFHAITEAVKEAASRRLMIPRRKITVVHRGRDPQRLGRAGSERRLRVRRELGLTDSDYVVLNAARQEYQKGQKYLLSAFEQVIRQQPSAVLLIAGRPGNATVELSKAAVELGSRARFLEHRDDVPDLMAAADVFVLPSLWEGLGCVLIEAMALELPIVASDLPPVREVAPHNEAALLVPAANPEPIASALVRLAQDAELGRRLARRGRELFESRFTLEQSARGMLGVFERVARNSTARAAEAQ